MTRKQVEDSIRHETVVPWSEGFRPNGWKVTFDGAQYQRWAMSLLPERLKRLGRDKFLPLGKDKLFRIRTMPTTMERSAWFRSMGYTRGALELGPRRGVCMYDRPVGIPQIVYRRDPNDVWMSLTMMEVLTQRPGLRKARGHVLVGGLGMGWFARRCCDRKKVKSVTVYELDPHVAKWFRFDHPKLKVVVADVYEANLSDYDSVLFDIWPGYGRANYDSRFKGLQARHSNMWGWGDVNY